MALCVDTAFGQTQTPTVFLSSHGMCPHRCLLTRVYEPVYVFLQWGQTNLVVPPPLPPPYLVTYFHKGVGPSLVFFRFSSSSSPWYAPLSTSSSSPSFLLQFSITIIKIINGTNKINHKTIIMVDGTRDLTCCPQ